MKRACFDHRYHGRIAVPKLLKPLFFRFFSARLKSCPDAKRAFEGRLGNLAQWVIVGGLFLALWSTLAAAQKSFWRQATDAELSSLLPARAPVEKEHIETEMRTASGIVDSRGRYIAGVVLITAGYSADGKYSHYLMVQAPLRVGGIVLKPGEYAFGYTHAEDVLRVHFNDAATGTLLGTTDAHLLNGTKGITSLHIWPPATKSVIQIGRFAIPYELVK